MLTAKSHLAIRNDLRGYTFPVKNGEIDHFNFESHF